MGLSRILIVEDTEFPREMLARQLTQMGYDVVAACNGDEAWDLIQRENINFIITDWMMPRLNGIELCRRIRSASLSRYIYIILLTSKGENRDLIAGMEAGADDFMVKPYNPSELKVRVRAGERVLQYEKTMIERNIKLGQANQELSRAYGVIRKNLKLAGKLHEALLPLETSTLGDIHFESLFVPCEFVAGDIFNFFKLKEGMVIFYLLDVAGHGIPAAMLSFTLSHYITPVPFREGSETNFLDFADPIRLAEELNHMFEQRSDGQQYFTLVYGTIDLATQHIQFTQAGHPPLIHLPAGGQAEARGEGGFPMGLFPDVTFDLNEFRYQDGDRIFIYSDGVTECFNPAKKPYTLDRLLEKINETRDQPLKDALRAIKDDLTRWRQSDEFEDDLSLLAFEFGEQAGEMGDM